MPSASFLVIEPDCNHLHAQSVHRCGSELAAVVVLTYAALAYVLYSHLPCFVTGLLLGAKHENISGGRRPVGGVGHWGLCWHVAPIIRLL